MIDILPYFTESLDLKEHPITKTKARTRLEYCQALSYIVKTTIETLMQNTVEKTVAFGKEIPGEVLEKNIFQRLALYYKQFQVDEKDCLCDTENQKKKLLHSLSACTMLPWRYKQRYWLLCDTALILLDRVLIETASGIEKAHIGKRASVALEIFCNSLFDSNVIKEKFSFAECLANQYRANIYFHQATPRKLIVTANMSAGKSTLINALIGKKIARTSQEACTGNVCYMYNKPFEDGMTALAAPEKIIDASYEELKKYDWQGEVSIATFFNGIESVDTPYCIIDTPGVNAALYKEHSEISRNALTTLEYEKLLYIIGPTNLGTDAELKHLKWVIANVPKEKIVFVLNKLDDYRSDADNIDDSIQELRNDLIKLGFEKPFICPVSAYFGLLLKLKLTNQSFDEDEQDEYALLAKKFNKKQFDLSHYYGNVQISNSDTADMKLYKHSGLYSLEKHIYGGIL